MTIVMEEGVVQAVADLAGALRASGVKVPVESLLLSLRGIDELGLSTTAMYWSCRTSMCSSHADLVAFDRIFPSVFSSSSPTATPSSKRSMTDGAITVGVEQPGADAAESQEEVALPAAAASHTEVLSHMDLGKASDPERRRIEEAISKLRITIQARKSRRYERSSNGRVDINRTLRSFARGAEEIDLLTKSRSARSRPVVLLMDISGSMSAYASASLHFGYALTRNHSRVEVFTMGTRLTRITLALKKTGLAGALAAVSNEVPDWSGGTRLGEQIERFVRREGARGYARGAMVVIVSDGWERGSPEVLDQAMERLRRLAHQIIWLTPKMADPEFAPETAGLRAALPHVDLLLSGHSLDSFKALAAALSQQRGPSVREKIVA
jgi:uncharacterized protein